MKYFIVYLMVVCLAMLSLVGQDKVSYQEHFGKAELKTDLHITGSFQYKSSKTGLPYYIVEDSEVGKPKKIDVPMFRSLEIYGGEAYVTARPDTTDFVWVDAYDDLLRIVRKGKLMLYDNSKIISENYKELEQYVMVAQHETLGTKTIKKISQLEPLMSDRPYFMASAKATGKYESRDFGVILYLIDLYNNPDPMKKLQWKKITLLTRKGDVYQGVGYVQPMDLRNEYNTSASAYVHFFQDGEFKLFRHDDLKEITLGDEEYEVGYFGLTNKYFFGRKWEHEGYEYLVVPKIVNRNNYYYFNIDANEQDYVILRKSSGSYLKPDDEVKLRMEYFK